jgi:subtilisin-like proprotein convertase family protein
MKNTLVLASLVSISALGTKAASFTFTPGLLIPDGSASGIADVQTISDSFEIAWLTVTLDLTGMEEGGYNGDLYAYLQHDTGLSILLNRVGKTTSNPAGYEDGGMSVTFDDSGLNNGDIHNYQLSPGFSLEGLAGVWQTDGRYIDPSLVTDETPQTTSLNNFNGLNIQGEWTLFIADLESGATSRLDSWSLDVIAAENENEFPPTAPVPEPAFWGSLLGVAMVVFNLARRSRARLTPASNPQKI